MEAHKVAEGDPSLLPQRPLTLLSGQTELPTLPLWRCAMCTQVWQFKLTLGPFQCMQRMLHLFQPQTEGIHKALEACPWHGVTYNLPKYFSRFHVIFPWLLLFFAKFHDFSRFSRCTLIFPGFPVNVGTLLTLTRFDLNKRVPTRRVFPLPIYSNRRNSSSSGHSASRTRPCNRSAVEPSSGTETRPTSHSLNITNDLQMTFKWPSPRPIFSLRFSRYCFLFNPLWLPVLHPIVKYMWVISWKLPAFGRYTYNLVNFFVSNSTSLEYPKTVKLPGLWCRFHVTLRRILFLPEDAKLYKVLMRRDVNEVRTPQDIKKIRHQCGFFSTIEVSQVAGISSRIVGELAIPQKNLKSIGRWYWSKAQIRNKELTVNSF